MRKTAMTALLLTLLSCSTVWGQASWVTFAPPGGKFSVQMPETPQPSVESDQSPVGPITDYIFTDTHGSASYTVSYSDLPRIAVLFGGAGTIYDNARGALLKQAMGKQVSYTDVQVAGQAAKELVYQTSGATPGYGKARLLLVGDRLYVLNVTAPADQPELERFLQSFQITGN